MYFISIIIISIIIIIIIVITFSASELASVNVNLNTATILPQEGRAILRPAYLPLHGLLDSLSANVMSERFH